MENRRKQVLCPVEGKGGKTRWVKMGLAYLNRDDSINLYLDSLPVNGRLQIHDWDQEPSGGGRSQDFYGEQAPQTLLVGRSDEESSSFKRNT